MLQAPTQTTPDGIYAENARLRDQLERLRAENRNLRATLEAHMRRGGSAALYGPLELTAGTCIGPRRRRRDTSRGGRYP
jgi:hypothetical protein